MGWYTIEQPDVQERLVHATGLGHLQDASQTDIGTALARITAPDAVAIYDVGHGNCTALIERGRPSLYFDFGGGVLGNRSTFPAALQHFCVGADPLIVLSHWDYDHWSSGKRDPRALYCQWLVPRQRLGPVHTVFLGELHAHGNVLVWPTGLASASSGAATVEACTGSRKSRNDSGLALLVDHPDGSRMLLPGDCGYDHVPSAGGSFASVVVPHHGGRTASSVIPARDGRQSGRCVYSAGAGNSYGHPFPDVERAHAQVWNHELRTEHRGHSGLGHVHLYWDAHAAAADPACCGTYCELTCQQR